MLKDFGKIMVRTPLLPYATLFDKNGETKNLHELALKLLWNNVFMEGIHWSSASLYKRLLAFRNGKKLSEKKEKRLLLTLQKYIIRTTTRATPYGTFAGINLQNIHRETTYNPMAQRHLRIDMRILKNIIKAIEDEETLSKQITCHLNNTLYEVYHQFRFLEINKEDENKIQISSLDKTEVLAQIVSLNRMEGFKFEDFYPLFSDDFTRKELVVFFRELITTDFLVSELEPKLSDEVPFKRIKRFLQQPAVQQTKAASQYASLITRTQTYIDSVEEKPLGDLGEEAYKKLVVDFKECGILIADQQLFHVDLTYQPDAPLKISNRDLKNIKEAITLLGKLIMEKGDAPHSKLENFKRLFKEKYETKTVPLLEVLDPDIGIGFPVGESIGNNPDDFFKPENEKKEHAETKQNLSEWLINKIESLSPDNNELRILTPELRSLKNKNHLLANSFYTMGQLVARGNILLQNVGGVSANTLLSRFSYMQPEINALCKTIADDEKEDSKEVVFADIIWVPSYKVANISRGMVHTDYEIPVFYPASTEQDYTILLQDLVVFVENDQIVLFSKKLKRRVIPRLSNAHNFRRSTNPIYKFLCHLQYQGLSGFALHPDFTNSKKRTFPRIFYKNIILFPAHWILQESDIQKIKISSQPLAMLKAFFEQWKVGQYVSLVHADNELFMNTQNDSYLEILLGEIKNQKTILLKEWLYDPKDQSAPYTNQFILPLKKKQPIGFKNSVPSFFQNNSRTLFPGSEWVYFKIYCSTSFSDLILKELEKGFIAPLIQEGLVEKWFFIRYMDPHHHIRLRLNKSTKFPTGKFTNLLKERLNSFTEQGIVWKIQLGTYEREIERYGAREIINSEKLFHIDSQFCLNCLKKTNMEEDTNLRLLLAIKNMDYWLTAFDLDFKQKQNYCKTMEHRLKKEKSTEFLMEVKIKYRAYKDTLIDFMDGENFNPLFESRKELMKSLPLKNKNLPSYIHMSLNRWFGNQQRDWEYLVYYFCAVYYRTCTYIHRKK